APLPVENVAVPSREDEKRAESDGKGDASSFPLAPEALGAGYPKQKDRGKKGKRVPRVRSEQHRVAHEQSDEEKTGEFCRLPRRHKQNRDRRQDQERGKQPRSGRRGRIGRRPSRIVVLDAEKPVQRAPEELAVAIRRGSRKGAPPI